MLSFVHRILIFVGLALALTAGRAVAQDNFDANKTPAQLFANDCSGCHKSAAGLTKGGGMFGLDSFLREHYTASRQAATAIAGYLRSVDAEQAAAPAKRGKSEPRRKTEKPAKKDEAKDGESKSEKKSESKSDVKPEAKSEKPAEPKADAKPAEGKAAESPKSEPPKSESPKPEKSE